MEKEYKISWVKVALILVLFVVAIGIISLVMPKKKPEGQVTSNYINNINMMKEAGFEYFRGNNLPKNVGASTQLSLNDMLDNKLIMEIVDDNGNACSLVDSYVRVTKTLDNEYAMKVALSCEDKSDYIVTTIVGDKIVYVNNNSNDNNISSSSSGDNNYQPSTTPNNSGSANQGTSSTNNYYNNSSTTINQITNVNINYVNSCNTCSGSNCNNNCLSNVYYTVTFDANGGSYVPRQIVKSGDTANYATSYREGYTFLGWYLDNGLYSFNTPVTRTITLVAKWEKKNTNDSIDIPVPKNQYTVTFDSNGGSYVAPITVIEGEYASKPGNPTKSCNTFVAWHVDSLNGPVYYFSNPIVKNVKLVAEWFDDGTCNHTVSFDTDGGSYIASQTVRDGNTAYNPGTPVKSCYSFDGWYTSKSYTTRYNFNNPVRNDMKLYAKWIDDGSCHQDYMVTFNSNGGTYIGSQTVSEGNRAYKPSDPSRNGYTFLGWYYNGSEFNFNTRIYRNYTLSAMWEKDEVKYNTYCKIDTKRYYSTSYVSASQNTWNYSWQIRFDDLRNIQDLRITSVGYVSTTSMYTALYNDALYGKGISMTGGSNQYNITLPDVSTLMNTSLKSSNFTKSLSDPYYSGGYWYTTANVAINNYNNVSAYSSNFGKVYFVPFYFDVSYTNLNNCVDDKDSNSYKYSGYKIIKTYYR